MARSARWPFASLLVVVACGSEPRRSAGPAGPDPAAPTPDGGTDAASDPAATGAPGGLDRPQVTERPPRGVPHNAVIVATAISRGGTAALSRDNQGEVRLWPVLDGTAAPRAVPVKMVTSMRVQDGAAGILAGFAQATGGGHLVSFDRSGIRRRAADLSGPGAVLQVTPLGDASGAIVLFADHSLALVAPDGSERSTLARRGARVRAIEAYGDDAALAILRLSAGDGETDHVAVRVTTTGGKLAFGPDVALPLEPLEPTRFAVAPDGQRIAYTRHPDDKTAAREAEHRAMRRRPGPPGARPPRPATASRPSKIAVVDATTGADVTPEELKLQTYTDVTSLGFSASARLHVFDATNQSDVDLTAGVVLSGSLVRAGTPSIARDLLLTGYDVSLVLQVPGGATRYLGWSSNMPQRVALSTDGRRAAWGNSRGEVIIEELDGSREVYGGSYEGQLAMISFIGDDRVVVGSARGSVHVVDATTGKELGSLLPPGSLHQAEVDPRTGWLAGLRSGGGVWLVKLAAGAPMPTTTLAVADGAQQFALLAPAAAGAPLLLTSDGKHQVRRYTEAELVAGVSAKLVRERPVDALPRGMNRWDRRGVGYAFEARKLLVFRGTEQIAATTLGLDPADLLVSEDGRVILVLGRGNVISRVAADGTTMWNVSLGPGGRWWWSFSADGTRVAVVGGGGGLVLDTATGERVAAGCAWRFGITSAPPLTRAGGVVPVCR